MKILLEYHINQGFFNSSYLKNFKYTGHEACQTDESGKFLIIEVCLGIG